ncbi:MAG: HAMP domain-containing sensor histidine kinase [Candidatus Thorarchaeota archaeon]
MTIFIHRQSPESFQTPLIFVFGSWSIIETHLVYFAFFPYSLSPIPYESIIPLVVGSLVTIVVLAHAALWVRKTPTTRTHVIRNLWIGLGLLDTFTMIWVGEFTQVQLETGVPSVLDSPLGQIILMNANLAALYVLVRLWMTLMSQTGGRVTTDVLAVTMLAFWIAPNMLRSNYLDWTAGWWASEMMRFFGLLISVPLFGYLFIGALRESQDSLRRARLYTDVLTHDIRNYHHSISLSIDLLDMEGLPSDTRTSALEAIRSEIDRAETLVENALYLGKTEAVTHVTHSSEPVIAFIKKAHEIALRKTGIDDLEFNLTNEPEECHVLADELLTHVFSNLIINSIQNSPDLKRIDITVSLLTEQNKSFCMIEVIDHGKGIPQEHKEHLFSRYMKGAGGSGLGLAVVHALVQSYGGLIKVEDRVPGDFTKGTKVTIILRANSSSSL